jgi:glyoxylase I family protein
MWHDRAVARVTGIGGFFFRARDPEAINRWYGEHLGVVMLDSRTYDDPGWFQDRGETVFSAIDTDSPMPGSPERSWAITFRVDDLDGIVERLRATGITVEPHEQEYPNGRFAELADPEGNRVQLWEPNAASLRRDPGRSNSES